jgi:hypothetical protein
LNTSVSLAGQMVTVYALTEMEPEATLADLPPFWVEIYSLASGSTIDSYGCFEFDEDELAKAVEFIVEAKRSFIT